MTAAVPDLFTTLVAREAGAAAGLVPRLPTLFEDASTSDGPEPAGTVAVTPTVAAARRVEPPSAAPPSARPVPPAGTEAPAVERRPEVVRVVEGRVRVQTPETEPPRSQPRPGTAREPEAPAAPSEPGRGRHAVPVPEPARRPAPPGDQVAVLRPPAAAPDVATPVLESPGRREAGPVQVTVSRHQPHVAGHPVRPEPSPTSEAAAPVVQVSIGRVEVHAVPEPAVRRARRTEQRTQSLDDYLERRNRGSRA